MGYTINLVHKIQEYIDYMYHWMSRLAMSGVYEFYMEHQMLIILNPLHKEWMSVRLSLEYRMKSLDFNNLADEMLVERERRYNKKGIRCTRRSQVVWIMLLNSFHGSSRINLVEMILMK